MVNFKDSGVVIAMVPSSPEVVHAGRFKGLLKPEATFTLRTHGMVKAYEVPEFEMVDVPGPFVAAAHREINHWAQYFSEEGKTPKDGECLSSKESPESPDPILQLRMMEDGVFRLVYVGMPFVCEKCAAGEVH